MRFQSKHYEMMNLKFVFFYIDARYINTQFLLLLLLSLFISIIYLSRYYLCLIRVNIHIFI